MQHVEMIFFKMFSFALIVIKVHTFRIGIRIGISHWIRFGIVGIKK